MSIKTTKTKATKATTSSEIDLFVDVAVPRETKREVAERAGDLIIEAISRDLSNKKSPVSGRAFQPLTSKEYKKKKRAMGKSAVANLELTGEMKGDLAVSVSKSGKLEIGVFGDAALRADGHNNFSGKSKLPLRQFLPKEGEGFRSGINREIQSIINDAVAETIRLPVRRLEKVTTKAEFFDIMRESFGEVSNAKIRTAILENEELLTKLASRDLLRFL